MYKNYFFLNRLVVEINSFLRGSNVLSAFSQEKDKLNLEIKSAGQTKFLEISVSPGFPYLILKDAYHRAKKNTIDLFSDFVPSKILSLEIAGTDRVIKITLDSGSLFFTVRGKYTNAIFLDRNNGVVCFKKMPDDFSGDQFVKEMEATVFTSEFTLPKIKLEKADNIWDEVKTKYPFIGKEILAESKIRHGSRNTSEIISTINDIIYKIKTGKPVVVYDDQTHQLNVTVSSFKIFSGSDVKTFDDVNSTISYYINKKYYLDDFEIKRKRIEKHLEKEQHRLSSKLNNVKALIDKGSSEEEYKKFGSLLLINIDKFHQGMEKIEVPDIYSGNKLLEIKLNASLSLQKNANKYFEKAKNDKIRIEKSKELHKTLIVQFNRLKEIKDRLNSSPTTEDYNLIMKELKIKDAEQTKKSDDIEDKFKHYVIEKKYNVFVGKDSRNNDLLTTKYAKQNDYWFHARSVPGSHVVLKVENNKEIIPKNILKLAASIAAYHSKAKTSGLAPVSYAQKKYVVKKKGMEPGKVALLKEEVLIVKPEIPKGCEYISRE